LRKETKSNQIKIELRLGDHRLEVDAALLFLLEDDVWRFLVQPDPETLQLLLDQLLVLQRLQNIQDNKDERTSTSDCDDLKF
jgi:hypothetical protein